MEREGGSPLPEQFPSQPGGAFPLYHVFADLAEFSGGAVVAVRSSNPLRVEALAVTHEGKTRLLIANLTGRRQVATLPIGKSSAQIRVLDERNVLEAMNSPETFRDGRDHLIEANDEQLTVNLSPFAVARIDVG